jgi:hypothetical protein
MAFPDSVEGLRLCGYEFQRQAICGATQPGRGCGVEIDWWVTPNGKKIPLDRGTAKPHWATCSAKEQFRKLK